MNKDLTRQILIVLAVVATIAVNGLANALPINGLQTGEISDSFPVYFTPAGYVFAIWGVIYLGLLAYAVYQALPAQRQSPRLRSIRTLFLVGSLANIAWIFLWHYQLFPLTLVAMLVLLGTLIGIYLRLRIGRTSPPLVERLAVDLPFSIYLGWITVATIANVTSAAELLELERLWRQPGGLAGDHAGRGAGGGHPDGADPARRGLPAGAGLGLRRHRRQAHGRRAGGHGRVGGHGLRAGPGGGQPAARPPQQPAPAWQLETGRGL